MIRIHCWKYDIASAISNKWESKVPDLNVAVQAILFITGLPYKNALID